MADGTSVGVTMTGAMALAEEYDAEQPVIEAMRRGDRYAFGEFARRNEPWIRGVIFGVLGDGDQLDDVCQQVWTGVWQQLGRLRDPRRWRSWLYRLARNAAVDAGRAQTRRRRAMRSSDAQSSDIRSRTPQDEVMQAEHRGVVLDAVRALPALYREPFVLRHVEGWSYRQIAEVMELPEDTVETRLVRARRLLREALQDKV